MGIEKRPIVPDRIRKIPPHFSWIDRRFVRDGLIAPLSRDEIALYFFLAAVADREGLSFYGDGTIAALLKLSPAELAAARRGLVAADLIAFASPLYQVLSLPPPAPRSGGPSAIGEILRRLGGERM